MYSSSHSDEESRAHLLGTPETVEAFAFTKASIELDSDLGIRGEDHHVDCEDSAPQGSVNTVYLLLLTCSSFG